MHVADRGPRYSRASIAIERYLNDAEEPFKIRSSPESFEPSKGSIRRGVVAKDIKIGSKFAYQETEPVRTGEQEYRATLPRSSTTHPRLAPLYEAPQGAIYIPKACFFQPLTEDLETLTIAAHASRLAHAGVLVPPTKGANGKVVQFTHCEHQTVQSRSFIPRTPSERHETPSPCLLAYDGMTGSISILSIDQCLPFPTDRTRLRNPRSQTARVTARVEIRSLRPYRLCPSEYIIPYLDANLTFTSTGVSQTPYLSFAHKLLGALNWGGIRTHKNNAGMIARPRLIRKKSPPLGIPLAAMDELQNEYSQYIQNIVENDIFGYIPVAYIDRGSDLLKRYLGAICSFYSSTREKDNGVYLGSTPTSYVSLLTFFSLTYSTGPSRCT
jgi:hypothetical protein